MKIETTFAFEKETKGAVRYQEEGHAPAIGTLYVRKHAFANGDWPKKLVLVVSDETKAKK
jgi:hypothetical protein